MKTTSNSVRLSYTETGAAEITLTLTLSKYQAQQDINELKQILQDGKQLSVEVKKYSPKRSLDSNSYAWVLITKMADVMRTSKDELYIEMLRKYGQREEQLISVVAEGVETIFRALNNHCTVIGEGTVNGKLFKHIAILIGSSQFDTKSMAVFIDGVISECEVLGIETITENQIAELKSKWG